MKLDTRENSTVLAALRYWQRAMGGIHSRSFREIDFEIAEDGGALESLSAGEIDSLCERINCEPAPATFGPTFNASKFEHALINQIADRAVKMARELKVKHDKQSAFMDLEACHCNGCPLNLNKLLEADDGDFGHDIFGIRRFLDRDTGKLKGHFVPRCAMPERVANPREAVES